MTYSTELEEIAYSKDADSLYQCADFFIQPQNLTPEKRDQSFFLAGYKFANEAQDRVRVNVFHYFTWWDDEQTVLIFNGLYGDVVKRIRGLKDRNPK